MAKWKPDILPFEYVHEFDTAASDLVSIFHWLGNILPELKPSASAKIVSTSTASCDWYPTRHRAFQLGQDRKTYLVRQSIPKTLNLLVLAKLSVTLEHFLPNR